MTRPSFAWTVAWIVFLSSISAVASADSTTAAQDLFERGLGQMKAGDFVTACPALRESYRLEPLPGTLFTLAECEARAGRVASAVARFSEYIDVVQGLLKPERDRQAARLGAAEQRRDELRPQVPHLTISVPADTPEDAVLRLGEEAVPRVNWNVSIPVDPGSYTLTITLGSGVASRAQATLAPSETAVVALALPVAPAPVPVTAPAAVVAPKPAARPAAAAQKKAVVAPNRHSVWPYVAFGVGAAGIVTGGVAGAILVSKRNTVSGHCEGKLCDDAGYAATRNIGPLDTAANVGFAVGIVGLAAGVVLLITEGHSAPATAGWRPNLALGRSAGTAGLEGTW